MSSSASLVRTPGPGLWRPRPTAACPSTTFSGQISGGGWLTKTGSGNLVLSGSDSYSGGTLVNAGTLQIGSGGTAGSLAGNITNNAALVFNRSDSPTFGGVISGSGGLTQAGTGILTLAGSNTYSGGTTIWAGAISLNNANAAQDSTVTVGANSDLLFNTNSGAIATFNVGGLAGSGNFSLADGSHALVLSAGGNGAGTTYSGGLSGAGSLAKTGSGILDLCGSNTYTGTTTVAGGGLELDFSQPGAPAANILNNAANSSSLALGGGTLAIQGNANTTNSQNFNGLAVNAGGAGSDRNYGRSGVGRSGVRPELRAERGRAERGQTGAERGQTGAERGQTGAERGQRAIAPGTESSFNWGCRWAAIACGKRSYKHTYWVRPATLIAIGQ